MYPQLTVDKINQKSVLIRLDLDVPVKENKVVDETRLDAALPSLALCLEHARKILIIGHLGRPKTRDSRFSLKPVLESLKRLINQDISLIDNLKRVEKWGNSSTPVAILENLRFWPGEQNNDPKFAINLAKNHDIFINDSFGTSHREVASVVGIPRILPTVIGPRFHEELQAFSPIINNPKRPITLVLGGAKAEKLKFVDNFIDHFDTVLIGGALAPKAPQHPKIMAANLVPDGLDITADSAQHFSRIISQSATIIWNGPMGKFEDEKHLEGTKIIAQAVTSSPALKIAGGADTEAAITFLDLNQQFDHISLGGGAMLYYLAHHSLPALEAIR